MSWNVLQQPVLTPFAFEGLSQGLGSRLKTQKMPWGSTASCYRCTVSWWIYLWVSGDRASARRIKQTIMQFSYICKMNHGIQYFLGSRPLNLYFIFNVPSSLMWSLRVARSQDAPLVVEVWPSCCASQTLTSWALALQADVPCCRSSAPSRCPDSCLKDGLRTVQVAEQRPQW